MGLFDVFLQKELKIKKSKEQMLELIKAELSNSSKNKPSFKKGILCLDNFRAPTSILKYNLSVDLEQSDNKYFLTVKGELQQVIIILFVILFSILYTYGFGVILVVAFTFLQKKFVEKYLTKTIEELDLVATQV